MDRRSSAPSAEQRRIARRSRSSLLRVVRDVLSGDSHLTAASDWAEARVGSGAEHPDLLPPGDTHLNVERTFSFVDLSGFTAYTRDHGPHAAVARLAEFRQVTRNVAAKRGVRVAKWLGDGAMLIGVEQPPVIALGAHIIQHFAGSDVGVRVGVATGTALLFEGDDYIGEPVNLAFKLCDAAEPGEMLAHCSRADLPDWVHAGGDVEVHIRGVGTVGDIVRLQPRLVTPRELGAA